MNEFRLTTKLKIQRLLVVVTLLLLSGAVFAQDFPKEIRGYKVYRANISVKNQSERTGSGKSSAEAFASIGEPKLIGIALTGITFELSAEIDSLEHSGKVDFLTFENFRVNGVAVEIEEYQKSFEFQKNVKILLPSPVKIFVGAGQTLRGAWSEWEDSKAQWTITGRVFVFGRFKKAGFKFKRVVPIEINLQIKNPLPKI